MVNSLEICELVEQLTWSHSTCSVHSKKSYVVKNLMVITVINNQKNMLNWLRHQNKNFFAAGINKLIKRWHKCIKGLARTAELKRC